MPVTLSGWLPPAALLLVAANLIGCHEQFPRKVKIDGRALRRFSVQATRVGMLAVYAPEGDHPKTADLTVGAIRSQLSIRQLVDQIEKNHRLSTPRTTEQHFETGDNLRYQTCRIYVDDIGQPAMGLQVAERLDSVSVATSIVRELDNFDDLQPGRPRQACIEARRLLGQTWSVHREIFPLR